MKAAVRTTIASRLYLIGTLAMAAVSALAAVSIYFAVNTGRAAEILFDGGLVSAVEAGEIELLLEKHRRLIEAAPLEFDRRQIARDTAMADDIAKRIEDLVRRSDPAFTEGFAPGLPELWRHGSAVLKLADNFAQEKALHMVGLYTTVSEGLQERSRAHRHERISTADRETGALVSSARRLVNAVTGFALFACLLIGPLAFMLLRDVIVRLNRITVAMTRLAENDTRASVGSMSESDEITEMARAVEVFRSNAITLLDYQSQLQQLNRWLDVALNNMTRGLSMFDADHRLVVCNAAYVQIYDLPAGLTKPGVHFNAMVEHRRQLLLQSESDGVADGADIEATSALRRVADQASDALITQRFVDGRVVEVSVKRLTWGGWVALHEDVTDRLKAAEKISHLARHDTLTGLANRLRFREEMDRASIELADDDTKGFALLTIDLDRFKEVNDGLGHPIGDALLVAVGSRLGEAVRGADLVARLGGDEFAIIQRDVTCQQDVEALASRLVTILRRPFQLQGHRIEIGATLGIAMAPCHGRQPDLLLRNADIALYRAKGIKRGTCAVFDPAMEVSLRARRTLEGDLGNAIARGELELHYQPIVSLGRHAVAGCEALIRWRHPDRGLVSPAEFIPLAEETGLINDIGAWAITEACRAAATWPGSLRVSVNLSVAQFAGPDLAEIASQALRSSGLDPSRLELEVTESLLLGDDPATLAHLHRLRALGLTIALDDFGTGYSSLSLLRSFPFDKLKIDQTFVRDLPNRPNCEAIVGAVAGLARGLDMTTVAEGVETEEHLARVEAAGCDEVQGYLFSRPVPLADVSRVIADIDRTLGRNVDVA